MMEFIRNRQAPRLVSVPVLALVLAACGGSQDEAPANAPADAGAPAEDARGAQLGGEIRGADPEDRAGATTGDVDHADGADHGDEEHDDHGDDDHEHDDHGEEMAGGEAHVHGHAELAAVLEGRDLVVSIQAPLASFGLPEKAPETEQERGTMEQARLRLQDPLKAVKPDEAASCVFSGSDVVFNYRGDHGSADIDYNFVCSRPDALQSLKVNLFEAYGDLEEIEAVFLAGADQAAATLTPSRMTLSRD